MNPVHKSRRKNEQGAATVEAIVSFSGFLFVIFTILNIVNFCRAQMLISNAMDTVTKELTQYSYFYQVSGLQKFDKDIQAIGKEGSLNLNTVAGAVGDLYGAMGTAVDSTEAEITGLGNSLQDGTITSQSIDTALRNVKTDGTNIATAINNMETQFADVADNPILYLKSIVAVASSEGLDMLKSHAIAAPLTKALMIKHFGDSKADADAKLESLGVVDGIDGMNFGMSTIFTKEHPNEIHLSVYYKIKIVQLFKWADFEATICKESRARAWLGGDAVTKTATPPAEPAGGAEETPSEGTPTEGTLEENTEEVLSAEQIKAQMVEKYGQADVDAVCSGVDTETWTVDDWEYQIWLHQNSETVEKKIEEEISEETVTSEQIQSMMSAMYGSEIVTLINSGNDTSDWTADDWLMAIWCYQYTYDNQAAILLRMQMVELYGQETVNAVSAGVDTLYWTAAQWHEQIALYLAIVPEEEDVLKPGVSYEAASEYLQKLDFRTMAPIDINTKLRIVENVGLGYDDTLELQKQILRSAGFSNLGPGEKLDDIKAFKPGTIRVECTNSNIKLYRRGYPTEGTGSHNYGKWWTDTKLSIEESRDQLAILDAWGNPLTGEFEMTVPAGTIYLVGIANEQTDEKSKEYRAGGATQYWFNEIKSEWVN